MPFSSFLPSDDLFINSKPKEKLENNILACHLGMQMSKPQNHI